MLNSLEKISALCRSRGFIFPGSEIYGGFANTYDYGHLGVELKANLRNDWWKKFIRQNPYTVGVDSGILLNPLVWEASGHVGGFSDPMIDCRGCKSRFRADHLVEEHISSSGGSEKLDAWPAIRMERYIKEEQVPCPKCGVRDFTNIRQFNMMFKTQSGVTDESLQDVYLRPETAQGIFINFKNIARTTRRKIPFGIGQVGHSFRNEITTGHFTYRTREFEQMELEFFCEPGTDGQWFDYWLRYCLDWLSEIGIKEGSLRTREHGTEELSFYSTQTTDIEFKFPFGWGELWGIANRGDYDLTQHMKNTSTDMNYQDPTNPSVKYVPYCIEPSLGLSRLVLAVLCDAYDEENLGTDEKPDLRTVLRFKPHIAPIKAAVLPLSKKPELAEPSMRIYQHLLKHFSCEYDDTTSIGKRYRRQDEIGTPFCITFDFDSLEDECVTIRQRDSMEQERVKINGLVAKLEEMIGG